jgi:hypothetical protein
MDALGDPTDVAQSRELGRAAVHAVLALAAANTGAVLDSTWYPYTEPLLRARADHRPMDRILRD